MAIPYYDLHFSFADTTKFPLQTGALNQRIRPIKPGYSVSGLNYTQSSLNYACGTITGFFRDDDNDVIALVTNASCAQQNLSKVGNLVYQPALIDNPSVDTTFHGWGEQTDYPIEDLPYFGFIKKIIPLNKLFTCLCDIAVVKIHENVIAAGLIDPRYPDGSTYKIRKGYSLYPSATATALTITDIVDFVDISTSTSIYPDASIYNANVTSPNPNNYATHVNKIVPVVGVDIPYRNQTSGLIRTKKWGRTTGFTNFYVDFNTLYTSGDVSTSKSIVYDKSKAGVIPQDNICYFSRLLKTVPYGFITKVSGTAVSQASFDLLYRNPTTIETQDNGWPQLPPGWENKKIATITIPGAFPAFNNYTYYTDIPPWYIKGVNATYNGTPISFNYPGPYTGNPATGLEIIKGVRNGSDIIPITKPSFLPGDAGSLVFLDDMTIVGMLIGGITNNCTYYDTTLKSSTTIGLNDYTNSNIAGYLLPFYDVQRLLNLKPYIP